jgi:hypothetical protein
MSAVITFGRKEKKWTKRRVEDYVRRDDIDGPRLLRDGERMRVPMFMADGSSSPRFTRKSWPNSSTCSSA